MNQIADYRSRFGLSSRYARLLTHVVEGVDAEVTEVV